MIESTHFALLEGKGPANEGRILAVELRDSAMLYRAVAGGDLGIARLANDHHRPTLHLLAAGSCVSALGR